MLSSTCGKVKGFLCIKVESVKLSLANLITCLNFSSPGFVFSRTNSSTIRTTKGEWLPGMGYIIANERSQTAGRPWRREHVPILSRQTLVLLQYRQKKWHLRRNVASLVLNSWTPPSYHLQKRVFVCLNTALFLQFPTILQLFPLLQ